MKAKRPVLEISRTNIEIWLDIISLGGIIFILLFLRTNYPLLPAEIPTHFNSLGVPDAWGSKTSLLILTGVMLVLYAGLKIAERFPQVYNYLQPITSENARYQYLNGRMLMASTKTVTVYIFIYLIYGSIEIATGNIDSLSWWFLPVVIVAMVGTVGYFMVKLSSKTDKL